MAAPRKTLLKMKEDHSVSSLHRSKQINPTNKSSIMSKSHERSYYVLNEVVEENELVCKVMTSYGTTLVVLLRPNQITQRALSEAIELKHETLYGLEYGSNVRCTRIDGFSRVNDEGAPCGVSYPIDDDSLKTCEFVSYLAQLTKGGALTSAAAENNKKSNNNNNQEKNKNQSNAAMDIDGFNKEVLSPKSLIDANVKAAAKGSTPLSTLRRSTQKKSKRKKQKIDEVVRASPLALLFTKQCRDIFETFIVGKLRPRSDLKFLNMAFKDARDAVERAKIKLPRTFNMRELSSISQLEFAWDNYHWGVERYETQEWFCWRVVRMNKLEYLVWLREVKNCAWNTMTINWAAEQGNLAMVKYCVENGCPMNAYACSRAAEKGHLDILKYLHENDCPWDRRTIAAAAAQGNLAIVKYCVENGCPMEEDACARAAKWACANAAKYGHLDVLKCLRENDCPWDLNSMRNTVSSAANQGNLAMMKYCVENGCPMNADACAFAAREGHLDVLKYLHENDCPWHSLACYLAHENNHVDCLNYLIEQKCPGFTLYLPPAPAAQ